MDGKMLVFKSCYVALVLLFATSISVYADEIDVYFVTGQSNASNFANLSGTGPTDVGFTLHFARSEDAFVGNYPDDAVAVQFSSDLLDTSLPTSILAMGLQQGDRDVAIIAFTRVASSLALVPGESDTSWFPGSDPANGEVFNDALCYNFLNWSQARINELQDQGHTINVRGIFWFQGERDGATGFHEVYEENFTNLVFRFRETYGQELRMVATELHEIPGTGVNWIVINDALESVANADVRIGFVQTFDLAWLSPTDVHLSDAGYMALAPRWSAKMLELLNLGDVNGDGMVSLLDVAPFVQILIDGTFDSAADINQDGIVDLLDVVPFVELLLG